MSSHRLMIVACAAALGCAAAGLAGEGAERPPAGKAPEPNPIRPAESAPGGEQPADPVPTPEQAAEIAKLIPELGGAKYEGREAARKRLLEVGAPALAALRQASRSKDLEVATSSARLVEDIGKHARAHVRIKVLRPSESGEREIILETSESTVTVRETKKEFTVAVQRAQGAAEILLAPTREEFQKKFPEAWKRWAEPALDASDPDKLAVEAMARQLMPEIIAAYVKQNGIQPSAEEKAEAEKFLREELRKALEAHRAEKAPKDPAAKPPAADAPAKAPAPKN